MSKETKQAKKILSLIELGIQNAMKTLDAHEGKSIKYLSLNEIVEKPQKTRKRKLH